MVIQAQTQHVFGFTGILNSGGYQFFFKMRICTLLLIKYTYCTFNKNLPYTDTFKNMQTGTTYMCTNTNNSNQVCFVGVQLVLRSISNLVSYQILFNTPYHRLDPTIVQIEIFKYIQKHIQMHIHPHLHTLTHAHRQIHTHTHTNT